MVNEAQEEILTLFLEEREFQDKKWGEQNHDNLTWLAILIEEVGEAAKEVLEHPDSVEMGRELVQVAAVVIAWLESVERRFSPQNLP